MAEDRMVSDEILLGLINSKGGGGGTSDYSQLSNKPQINSVELSGNKSLSDLGIASASAVKTEFIGTTAEWNALTAEQKKAYDTYQITDDYTESSGGLPDYSTTEQLTGQKWIDGKPIYTITVVLETAIAINSGQWRVTPLSAVNIDTITLVSAKSGKLVFGAIGAAIADGYVNLMNNSAGSLSIDTFTLWYTKTT